METGRSARVVSGSSSALVISMVGLKNYFSDTLSCQGLPAPIVGSMAETASLFLAYSAFQNVIRTFASSPTTEPLTIPQLGLAAGGAGFLTSFVLFVPSIRLILRFVYFFFFFFRTTGHR